jgi:hypothetical protein
MEDLGKLEYYRTDTYRSFNRAWKGNFLLFIQPELIRLNRGGGDELPDTIDELRQPALPGDALFDNTSCFMNLRRGGHSYYEPFTYYFPL